MGYCGGSKVECTEHLLESGESSGSWDCICGLEDQLDQAICGGECLTKKATKLGMKVFGGK